MLFHNLKGYDAHHIIGKEKRKKINCIPQNHEKYISFSPGKLDFVDTFQFLSTSLDKLSAYLVRDGLHKFIYLQSYVSRIHPGNQIMKLRLLSRKGVYPYLYVNSFKTFSETQLPPKRAFNNDLNGTHLSNEDYLHAEWVWAIFKLRNLGEYHDLYTLKQMFAYWQTYLKISELFV